MPEIKSMTLTVGNVIEIVEYNDQRIILVIQNDSLTETIAIFTADTYAAGIELDPRMTLILLKLEGDETELKWNGQPTGGTSVTINVMQVFVRPAIIPRDDIQEPMAIRDPPM